MMLNPDSHSDVDELCRWSGLNSDGYKYFDSPFTALAQSSQETADICHNSSSLDTPDVRTPAIADPKAVSAEVTPEQFSKERLEQHVDKPLHKELIALARVHHAAIAHPAVLPLIAGVGGCGVTTILSSLGRAFSILGERVLLVDEPKSSTLPLFFNAYEQGSGLLLSKDPMSRFEGALHVLQHAPKPFGKNRASATSFRRAMAELAGSLDQIVMSDSELLSLCADDADTSRRIRLVVITPEMRSILAAEQITESRDTSIEHRFLLNKFNKDSDRDAQMRSQLQNLLGSQLLPFTIPESPAVEDALLQGMTVLDLAPQSEIADAFFDLAEWYRANRARETPSVLPSEENNFAFSNQF